MIKKTFFAGVVLAVVSAAAFAAEPVGLVVDAVGDVRIVREGRVAEMPALRQPVYRGDIIETQKDGGLKILFRDDTILTVKENSRALISEFLFHPKKSERKAVFDVVHGTIRSVVGRFFGADQPVEIRTPTAVGGIRGTDVAAVVTAKKTNFYCFDGLLYVANIDRPGDEITLERGMTTEVLEGRFPAPAFPIPHDILQNSGALFDVALTSGTPGEGAVAEGSQLSQQINGEVASQSVRDAAPVMLASVFDATGAARSAAASVLNVSPTAASDLGVQILPGGSAEASNTITIDIALP